MACEREVELPPAGADLERRRADLLVRHWRGQRDVYVDVVGSSPLTGRRLAGFHPGLATSGAALEKERKYAPVVRALGGDVGFLPFSFDTLGGLEGHALLFLQEVQRLMGEEVLPEGRDVSQSALVRVSFAIAYGVGVSLAARLDRCLTVSRVFVY